MLLTQLDSQQQLLNALAHNRLTQEAIYSFKNPFVSYRYEVSAPNLDSLKQQMADWYKAKYQPYFQTQTEGLQVNTDTWLEKSKFETLLLQKFYVADNPQPLGKQQLLEDRSDGSVYGQQHKKYHSSFKEIVDRYGFQDLMLVDANSLDVLYNVNKGPVFASNLQNGAFADTELAKLAKTLKQKPKAGLQISAISAFNGSFQQQVLFFGVPVFHPNSSETPVGFLIAQYPVSRFTDLMTGNQKWQDLGLGQTGDLYLVDQEQTLVTEALPLQQWTHISLTLRGNTAKLYINGDLRVAGHIYANPSDLFDAALSQHNYIGKSQWASDPMLNGAIDDFRRRVGGQRGDAAALEVFDVDIPLTHVGDASAIRVQNASTKPGY